MGEVDQRAEVSNQLLGRGVAAFGVLHVLLMPTVIEADDLNKTPATLTLPLRADLLEHLEPITAEPGQGLLEPLHELGMLSAFFRGDDVTVGL